MFQSKSINYGADRVSRNRTCVFDDDLVRRLCREIVEEKDPEKVADLLSLLQAVIKDDEEEVRVRALFLVQGTALFFADSKNAA